MRRSHPPRWQLFPYEPFDEFLTPEMQQAVDRCLEERDFDLLQLEYTQMGAYAQRANEIPSLLTKHEVDFAACARRARTESNPTAKFRWFYNYLQVLDREVRLTKMADAAICMTDPDARELRKFVPEIPVHVVNTGVDLDYFSPPDRPSEDMRLIFVGAFQHLPNVEAMLFFCRDVFPAIRKKVPETELLIVGSNPPASISALTAIPGVQVTGFVPDIRPYMADSSVYVVPLRLGVGIRGKILEAWGMRMAVVSTSVGCAGLQFEHGRNLLVGDTPELFAEHVVALLGDPVRRNRLGTEGRKTAEEFYSWESSALKLDTLYQSMIAGAFSRRYSGNVTKAGEEQQVRTGTGRIG
jgi:glycosyltransferase involved in cell wall biosynthesis